MLRASGEAASFGCTQAKFAAREIITVVRLLVDFEWVPVAAPVQAPQC